jgi:transcriptional regulator with XRE-family HTH domain
VAAAAVRDALRVRKIRQRDLAAVLGLSQPAVSNRLTGHTAFTLDELDAIAKHFDVPVSRLLEPEPAQVAS